MSDGTPALILGEVPAVVHSYDKATRECRVHIPGMTDGGKEALLAEIRYPVGDKSVAGEFSTDILMLAGDHVWVSFIGGDSRFPLITGARNPQVGNGTDWRRWHQANIELLAKQLLNVEAGMVVTVKAGALVKIDAPLTHVLNDLTVGGMITGLGGMAISGGDGASFSGRVAANGDSFTHNDVNVGSTHSHTDRGDGNEVSPPH